MRQCCQNLPEMDQVVILTVAVNKNVIEVDDNKLFDEGLEDLMHDTLEGARCIGEAKRHHQPLVQSFLGLKGRLPLISWSNTNLMIATP